MKNKNLFKTEKQTKISWDKIQLEMKNKFVMIFMRVGLKNKF